MGNQRTKGTQGFLGALALSVLMSVEAPVAQAVPALQLDIVGGSYDNVSQTVITTSNAFTLYALLDPAQSLHTYTYYLSIALVPATSIAGNYGFFSINGTQVNVTGDMTFGTPPLEGALATFDGGDLEPHAIYPTYFREIAFTFSASNTSGVYDTAANPGGISANIGGTGLRYAAFTMDRSLLSSGYQLHFDLYNEKIRSGDIDVNSFAPFTHDAQTRSVPEPSAALLMGIALVGFGLWKWRSGTQTV